MTRRQTILGVSVFALACLAIGVVWTVRTQPPSAHPWWAGKDPKLRAEVWEPGKDMATVAMTMNKKTIDTMVALGVRAQVKVGEYSVDLRHYWRQIQALPPGQRLTLDQDGAKIYVWIETSDVKLPPIVPTAAAAESTGS
ncbi:MAG TPA: hypothetical protein VK123_01745 [Candidatus Limnocylindrales bacterium]|nr:hypothetical protein [Candidatus Limnocylindrales bacterium]